MIERTCRIGSILLSICLFHEPAMGSPMSMDATNRGNPAQLSVFSDQALAALLREAFHEGHNTLTAWLIRLTPNLQPTNGFIEAIKNGKRGRNKFAEEGGWANYRPQQPLKDRLSSILFAKGNQESSSGGEEGSLAVATLAKKRKGGVNEDSTIAFALPNGIQVGGVFDGVSQGAAGDETSRTAAQFVKQELLKIALDAPRKTLIAQVKDILIRANQYLQQHYTDKRGTTATVTIVRPIRGKSEEVEILTFNAGDSRSYAYLPNGSLHVLTVDNLRGQVLIGLSKIKRVLDRTNQPFLSSVESRDELTTLEEQLVFYKRNIAGNWLASMPDRDFDLDPQVSVVNMPVGTRLLVTSDGIHDNLADREIMETLRRIAPGKGAAALVRSARLRSQSQHMRAVDDDLTAVEIVTRNNQIPDASNGGQKSATASKEKKKESAAQHAISSAA